MVLPNLTPDEIRMKQCLLENKHKTLEALKTPSAGLISNAPLMIFGGAWVHQRFNPNMWPSALGVGGIHRAKFMAFGFSQALLLPIFYRISVSSDVLKDTMTQYGFKYPADKQVRNLITTAMKSIHDDRENSKSLGVDPKVMNQQNLVQPVQTSPDSAQTPLQQNTSDNFKPSEMYQNQNSFKNNQDPYQYNPQQSDNKYTNWADQTADQGVSSQENPTSGEEKNKYKSWDDIRDK